MQHTNTKDIFFSTFPMQFLFFTSLRYEVTMLCATKASSNLLRNYLSDLACKYSTKKKKKIQSCTQNSPEEEEKKEILEYDQMKMKY